MGTGRQGAREEELPFLLLCLFSLQASPQCPDPRGCCSKGSYSWNSAWESSNRILAKLRVISGRQKEALLCHLLTV